MWFECEQPFVGEARCVTRKKKLRERLGPGKRMNKNFRENFQ